MDVGILTLPPREPPLPQGHPADLSALSCIALPCLAFLVSPLTIPLFTIFYPGNNRSCQGRMCARAEAQLDLWAE